MPAQEPDVFAAIGIETLGLSQTAIALERNVGRAAGVICGSKARGCVESPATTTCIPMQYLALASPCRECSPRRTLPKAATEVFYAPAANARQLTSAAKKLRRRPPRG